MPGGGCVTSQPDYFHMHYGLKNVETGCIGGCTPQRLIKTQRCREDCKVKVAFHISEAEISMIGNQRIQNLLIFKSTKLHA